MPESTAAPPAISADRLSGQTTPGVLWHQAEQSPTVPVLHFFSANSWQSMSWAQMQIAILRIAGSLLREGVGPGERVVLMGENRVHWILTDFAIQLIGAVTVPIYPTLTPAAAMEIARDCGARLAIVSSALLSVLSDGATRCFSFEIDVDTWMTAGTAGEVADTVQERAVRLRPDDVATIIYTSGTTGSPKGAVLTHRGLTTMAASGAESFRLRADDALLSFLPYSHVFERVEGIMAPLSVGASIWISRGAQFLGADLQAARPTLMLVVPRVLEKLKAAVESGLRQRSILTRVAFTAGAAIGSLAGRSDAGPAARALYRLADRLVLAQLRDKVSGGRLRFMVSGGAPLRHDVEAFFWSIGLPVYQGWGLTETTAAATANRPGAIRHGTVGQPLPGVDVRIEPDGELLVRGPGVMREYFGQPGATAEVLSEGWLKTGDIGAIDADGYVTITDRKKDLIKTSTGKYVAPQLLEAELQRFRYIGAAVIVGDQRPYIVALIQPAWDELRQELKLDGPPEQLAADRRVQAMVRTAVESINHRLSNFETIKRFRIVAGEFTEANGELTPSLKVRRRLVQQRYQRLIDEMYGMAPTDS